MKKKFYLFIFVSGFFSITVCAQTADRKTDSINSAKQIVLKNNGEKDFPNQIKKDQLQKSPEILKNDSVNTANKQKRKHKK